MRMREDFSILGSALALSPGNSFAAWPMVTWPVFSSTTRSSFMPKIGLAWFSLQTLALSFGLCNDRAHADCGLAFASSGSVESGSDLRSDLAQDGAPFIAPISLLRPETLFSTQMLEVLRRRQNEIHQIEPLAPEAVGQALDRFLQTSSLNQRERHVVQTVNRVLNEKEYLRKFLQWLIPEIAAAHLTSGRSLFSRWPGQSERAVLQSPEPYVGSWSKTAHAAQDRLFSLALQMGFRGVSVQYDFLESRDFLRVIANEYAPYDAILEADQSMGPVHGYTSHMLQLMLLRWTLSNAADGDGSAAGGSGSGGGLGARDGFGDGAGVSSVGGVSYAEFARLFELKESQSAENKNLVPPEREARWTNQFEAAPLSLTNETFVPAKSASEPKTALEVDAILRERARLFELLFDQTTGATPNSPAYFTRLGIIHPSRMSILGMP